MDNKIKKYLVVYMGLAYKNAKSKAEINRIYDEICDMAKQAQRFSYDRVARNEALLSALHAINDSLDDGGDIDGG